MPAKGFTAVTIDRNIELQLDDIAMSEFCKTKSEVIRLLIRTYRKVNGEEELLDFNIGKLSKARQKINKEAAAARNNPPLVSSLERSSLFYFDFLSNSPLDSCTNI